MKERAFNAYQHEVRAILTGRQTQFRRVVKPQPVHKGNGWYEWGYIHGAPKMTSPRRAFWHAETWERDCGSAPLDGYCPYGQPDDRLWVREAWRLESRQFLREGPPTYLLDYCADPGSPELTRTENPNAERHTIGKIRSSVCMPRWASRINLEITAVRVERVQSISEEDVQAEGVKAPAGVMFRPLGSKEEHRPYTDRDTFEARWDASNAKHGYSWESNPYVWVVSFKRVQP